MDPSPSSPPAQPAHSAPLRSPAAQARSAAEAADGSSPPDLHSPDRQVFHLQTIAQIGRTLATSGTLDQLLFQIVHYFTEVAGVRWTCIYLRDPKTDSYRLRGSKLGSEEAWSPPDSVVEDGIADLLKESGAAPRRDSGAVFEGGPEPRFFLPLFTEGAPTGFLLFGGKPDGGEIHSEEGAFLSTLAAQGALAIRHAFMLDETARMVEELTVLNEISRLVTRGSEPFAAGLQAMWSRLQPYLGLEWGLLVPIGAGAEEALLGGPPPGEGERDRIQRWCALLLAEKGFQLRRAEVVLLDSREVESSFPAEFRPPAGAGRTFALVPLFYDQELDAILLIRALGDRARFQSYRRMLQSLSPTLSASLQKARDHVKLERLATTDGLTGLYNHRYFHERLQLEYLRAYRLKDRLGLLFMDVDHFKSINDAFGHLYGDEVLARIAEILKAAVREIDVAARYGGEEFAIILPQASCEEAAAIGERVRFAVEQTLPLRLSRKIQRLTVSVGAAAYPETASTKQMLVEAADRALYLAKRSGRNRVTLAATESA